MKRLLMATVAGCALHAAALAGDLTFTWSFTGTTLDTPRSLCGSNWITCDPITRDLAGTFTLTVPDDAYFYSRRIVDGIVGTETIVYQTAGGQLNFYSLEDNFPESSELTWRSLWLWTGGGTENSYASDPDGYVTTRTQITYGAGLPPVGPPTPVPEPGPAWSLSAGLAMLAALALALTHAGVPGRIAAAGGMGSSTPRFGGRIRVSPRPQVG